jgi:hypothetical protein
VRSASTAALGRRPGGGGGLRDGWRRAAVEEVPSGGFPKGNGGGGQERWSRKLSRWSMRYSATPELREEETALLLGRRQLLAVRSSPPRKRTAPSGSAWFYAVGGLARGEAQSTLMLGELDSTAHRGWYSV